MKPKLRSLLLKALLILALLLAAFLFFELVFRNRVLQHGRATGLYNQKKYPAAEQIWKKRAGKKDGDYIPESSAGKVHYRRGDYTAALKSYQQAASEKGKIPGVRYDLGNAFYRSGDLDKALEAYKAAMLLAPDDQDAKSNYELVLRRQGYRPPPPSQGKDDDKSQQEQEQQSQQEQKEQYRNALNALDQKEAADRMAKNKPQDYKDGGKWW